MLRLTAFLVIVLTAFGARAYDRLDTFRLTAEEVALLPEYCRHTQVILERHGSKAKYEEWVSRVGNEFHAMHHYCVAVIALLRSYRARLTAQERRAYWNYAVDNLNYVEERSRRSFALLPEVLFRRGQAYQLLGRSREATRDYEESLLLNPAQPRTAFSLAQVLELSGRKQQALQVIDATLEHVPDSKLLLQERARLAGTK